VKSYYVYIMSGRTRVLYIGVTNDLARRVHEHRNKLFRGFTSKYSLDRLVYFEEGSDVAGAIEREKEPKAWRRAKKLALIESSNPNWKDLSLDWDFNGSGKSTLLRAAEQNESLRVDPSSPHKRSARSG